MRKIFIGILALLSATAISQATLSFVGNSYAILDANGGGDQYYNIDNSGDTFNPSYSGNLNGLTITTGQSLLLGGQVQTYPGQGGTTAWLGYKLYDSNNDLLQENDDINLSYLQTANNNDYWQQLASTSGVNLDQSLGNGTYTLQVWLAASNGNTIFDNNNNNSANYSATFSVVPEPVYPALGLFAGLLMLARFGRPLARKFQTVQMA